MVIVMKTGTPQGVIEKIKKNMMELGCEVHMSQGKNYCLLGLVGDPCIINNINHSQIQANPYVDKLLQVQHPFKLASRLFHPENTIVEVNGVKIGGGHVAIMAGPCSVESEEQLMTIALAVKKEGAQMLRGGAYKPRTSPYSFQGLEEEGLKLLKKAKEATGMPIVTEVMGQDTFDIVEEYADVLQIGARNMQNFSLLKRCGKSSRPILLKRGLCATIEELLMAAEYIMANGNPNVILCERGIRTFETYTRNTLDISAVPMVKELSHLPIIIDPSHATGRWAMVEPLSKAALVAGADGLIIEVHHQPEYALSDGSQSLKLENFAKLMRGIEVTSKLLV